MALCPAAQPSDAPTKGQVVEEKDRYREAVRTGLAKGLAATARGLSSASRALASTSRQLRPPEAADPWDADLEVPAAEDAEPEVPAAEEAEPETSADVRALVDQNARDVVGELKDLNQDELRQLRDAEAQGKARKTVLEAVDKLLAE